MNNLKTLPLGKKTAKDINDFNDLGLKWYELLLIDIIIWVKNRLK